MVLFIILIGAERLQEIADQRRARREAVLLRRLQGMTFTEIVALANETLTRQTALRDNENMPSEARTIQLEFVSNDIEVIGKFFEDNPYLRLEDPVYLEEQRRLQEERNRISQTAKDINKVLLDAMPIVEMRKM